MYSRNDSLFRNIANNLGRGIHGRLIVSSFALALCSFFYIYAVGSFFEANVNVLKDRVVYVTFFQTYVISEYVDYAIIILATVVWLLLSVKGKTGILLSSLYGVIALIAASLGAYPIFVDIIALLSIPIIALLLVTQSFFQNKNIVIVNKRLTFNYVAIIGISTGIAAIMISLLPVLFAIQPESISLRNFVVEILTLLSSSFSPILMALLVFCFPVKLLLNEFLPKRVKEKTDRLDRVLTHRTLQSKTKITGLVLAIILCIILVLIPHQLTINKDGQRIGVDTQYYVNWTELNSTIGQFSAGCG